MRQLTVQEKNHLLKHGHDPDDSGLNAFWFQDRPVEYSTGFAQFYNRDFVVNQSVLIPRIESEGLVELAVQKISLSGQKNPVVADIGTGSGCLGLTIYLELSRKNIHPSVYLSDISKEAIVVAIHNANRFGVEGKSLHFLVSNLLTSYPTDLKFDLIVANLPYIPTERILNLDDSVKKYEPKIALDGGVDGLSLVRRLIVQSKGRLSDGGSMILEIDEEHDLRDFEAYKQEWGMEIKKDQFGKNRFLILERK